MADEEKFKGIEKKTQLFKKQSKLLREEAEKTKCLCSHQKKNQPSLVKRDGSIYTCKQCEKDNINLSPEVLNQQKIDDAITVLDNVCDILKLNLRTDNPDDLKILNKVAKTQFFLRFMLNPLVAALKKRNGKSKKDKHEDNTWGKSRVI